MTIAALKTHLPGGGVNKWISTFYNENQVAGDVWWVGSNMTAATDTAGFGRSPEAPFKTLNYAVGTAAVANANALVMVLPGHVETIVAAGGVTMGTAGVTVRGLGTGRQRPQINYTTLGSGTFLMTAANCSIDNLVFTPIGVAAVATAITVSVADCSITNCEFEFANGTNQAGLGVTTTAGANRLRFINNWCHGTNNAGTTNFLQIVGGTDIQILNNIIQGAFTTTIGAINIATTAAVNIIIGGNILQNLTASAAKCISDTVTGSTGQVFNNRMQVLTGSAPIAGATLSWVGGNYYGASLGTLGTLI